MKIMLMCVAPCEPPCRASPSPARRIGERQGGREEDRQTNERGKGSGGRGKRGLKKEEEVRRTEEER